MVLFTERRELWESTAALPTTPSALIATSALKQTKRPCISTPGYAASKKQSTGTNFAASPPQESTYSNKTAAAYGDLQLQDIRCISGSKAPLSKYTSSPLKTHPAFSTNEMVPAATGLKTPCLQMALASQAARYSLHSVGQSKQCSHSQT